MKNILKWIDNIHPIKIYSILCIVSAIILFFITDGINQYPHLEYIIGILINSVTIPIGIIGVFILISLILPLFSVTDFRKRKKYNTQLKTLFSKFSDEELDDMDTECTFTSTPPCFPEYQQIKITGSMITSEIRRRKSVRTKLFLINNVPIWIAIAILFFYIGHSYK